MNTIHIVHIIFCFVYIVTSAVLLLVVLVFKVETIRKIICTVKIFPKLPLQ